jgi:uncharacterized protein
LRILANIFDSSAPLTARELADRLEAPPASVHRELTRGLDAGIITRTPVGRTQLYSAAAASPLYAPLRTLLERTVGVEGELRAAVSEEPGVTAAAIHDSCSRGSALRPESDVDLLVIGDADYRRLRKRLREAERRTGRRVDPVIYTLREARELYQRGNGFIKSVLDGPRLDLVGDVASAIIE